MTVKTFITSRLFLRGWREDDIEPLYQLMNQQEVMRYFPRPEPPSLDRVEKIVHGHMEAWEKDGYSLWALELLGTKELIGWGGLGFLPETNETEVAYLLGRAYWGKGYATEAARIGLRYGFGELGIKQIIGLVHPDNHASRHVIEKLGMDYIDLVHYWGIDLNRFRMDSGKWVDLVSP